MILHGVSPNNMLLSTLVPIPKIRKRFLNDNNNYRAIALGSIVCEYVLRSSDLQHGFKVKQSTSHCTFVLHEVIDYYTDNGSSVFLVLLDA